MLPSFVIGLREGLEAALIVGIIAAFLRKQGRKDLLRSVMIGVGVVVLICLGIGIALRAYSQNLPQKQQEGLETVIAVLAIGMVTYMVVWMRRNSRSLKGQLEGMASEAMAGTSNAGRAMVLMAFLAVIREGLETVVFLLAAFQESSNGATAGAGAVLGLVVAIALGYGIYRGGVKLNLSKFFRATGVVLVLVAAGLVVNAFHTAHEAGWVDFGQARTVDLTWLVEPGTVQASLLTGMLGLQPRPVVVEVVAWLVYLVPVLLYVVWPPGRPAPTRTAVRGGIAVAVLAAVAAIVLVVVSPADPEDRPTTSAGRITAQLVSADGGSAVVRTERQQPLRATVSGAEDIAVTLDGSARHAGLDTRRYVASGRGTDASTLPTRLSIEKVAELNGARLPTGIRVTDSSIPVTYRDTVTLTVWVDAVSDRVIDLAWTERVLVVAGTATVNATLTDPIAAKTVRLPAATVRDAVAAARADQDTSERSSQSHALIVTLVVVALVALLVALGFALLARRGGSPEPAPAPQKDLVNH